MSQILVVDDSSTVRNEVSNFLLQNGLTVTTAVDGQDGLDKLSKDSSIKLVIADINMPNMDGMTMVEKIRSDLGNKKVGIIMLTTVNDPEMKQRGKVAGVKGWIVKPFNGSAVVDVIKELAR